MVNLICRFKEWVDQVDKSQREELISAYLDGELNTEETDRAERWIADDPQAKKLFEELKVIRDAIHQLPRYQLKSDLTSGVLDQIIDQPVVSESQRPEVMSSAAYLDSSQNFEMASIQLNDFDADSKRVTQTPATASTAIETARSGQRRIVLWPALAIAVAVLLMIFSRSDRLQKDRAISRLNSAANMEGSPTPPESAELLEKNLLELKEKATANQMATSDQSQSVQNALSVGEISSKKKTTSRALSEPDRTESMRLSMRRLSRPDNTKSISTTYVFRVAPMLDLQGRLNDLTTKESQIRLVELGIRKKGEVSHHVFQLSGDLKSTKRVTQALKEMKGFTLESQKNYSPADPAEESSTRQRSATKLNKKDASQPTSSDTIRIIFIVPSS